MGPKPNLSLAFVIPENDAGQAEIWAVDSPWFKIRGLTAEIKQAAYSLSGNAACWSEYQKNA